MTTGELTLQHGSQQALLDLCGGRVVSYQVAGKQVLAGEAHSQTATYRSALLVPWPNRVAHGRWQWDGEILQLPINEVPAGNSLHGLVAFATFEVAERSEARARLVHDLRPSPGYPFALRIEASYRLSECGLECRLEAVVTGDRAAPVGLGVHPYLATRGRVDEVALSLPAERFVQVNALWEEQSRVAVARTDLDLRALRRIGAQDIDACFADLRREGDGRVCCRVVLPDGDEVVVWAGETARYFVIYTSHTLPGDLHRASLAVEPTTAPANALRSGVDLEVLEPGRRLSLDWGLTPSWLSD